MCYSCGCCDPSNDHGDARNLTALDMQGAADWAGTDVKGVVANINKTATGCAPEAAKSAKTEEFVYLNDEFTVLKAHEESRYLLLVAYDGSRVPHRGADGFIDIVSPHVLEKACWRFMDNGAKVGLWHQSGYENAARVVENYVYRGPDWTIKAADGSDQVLKAGKAWLVGVICEKNTWEFFKSGMIGGASPQGSAGRRVADPELLSQLRSTE